MASKLLSEHGFNRQNMKVLLGGWTAWKEKGYPMETTPGAPTQPAGGGAPGAPVVITVNPAP